MISRMRNKKFPRSRVQLAVAASAQVLTIFSVILLIAIENVAAAPYRPENDSVVLMRLEASAQLQALNNLRKRHLQNPGDLDLALMLVQRYTQLARTRYDERFFGQAEAILQRSMRCVSDLKQLVECSRTQHTIELLVAWADILQHRHAFRESEEVLTYVIALDARHIQARLLRASLRLASGGAPLALKDCAALIGKVEQIISTACLAQGLSLTGRLEEGYELLISAARRANNATAANAWALSILSELAQRSGELNEAEMWLRRALQFDPDSLALRLQLADILLETQRAAQVDSVLSTLPDIEPVLLRRAIAQRQINSARAAVLIKEWHSLIAQDARLGLSNHLGDLARGQLLLLDRPQDALITALENWKTQRQISDAHIVLMAAKAAEKIEQAQPVLQWLKANRISDVRLTTVNVS